MNTTQKLIQPKLGVLKLAEKLGNVSEACKVMAIPETASIAFRNSMKKAERWR